MEIGLKIIQAINNISTENLTLSVQVSLNGFSFILVDSISNEIISLGCENFNTTVTPDILLTKLVDEFETNEKLNLKFKKVKLIHCNNMLTLVPSALFSEGNLADYLKYNTKLYKSDFITYDVIKNEDIILVYIPYANVNNFIFDKFGSFEYNHSSTIFIDKISQLRKNSINPELIVNVNKTYFDLIAFNKNKIILYNRFNYETKEDFIYFILFTAEQINFNPENFKCILTGDIDLEDDLYKITYKFIRFIELLPSNIIDQSSTKSRNHFILKNSF